MLYAIHDALVRPLPGQKMGPSLAESWTESPDGRVYELKLRRGLAFHNGDPVTAEDVKFSFERYKGSGAKEMQARVQQVEVVDPLTVRFHLKAAWPDFMTFYGTTATAAGIVVPKKYLTQVGDDGFLKNPIGAGPYKFVRSTPGVEVVLEAYTGYWRHVPYVMFPHHRRLHAVLDLDHAAARRGRIGVDDGAGRGDDRERPEGAGVDVAARVEERLDGRERARRNHGGADIGGPRGLGRGAGKIHGDPS